MTALAFVVTLAGGLVVTQAQAQDPRALIDTGHAKEAVALLRAQGGTDPDAQVLLGIALFHADETLAAIEVLRPAVAALAPAANARAEAVQVLGLALYVSGRVGEAIPYLEETQRAFPQSTDTAYALGIAYVQANDAARARRAWAKAFGVAPESAAASLVTAQMMIRAGFEDAADAELRRAVQQDVKLPQAHFLLGQSALFRGRLDEAVALLQEELALNPAHALAMDRLGDAYLRQGKTNEALAVLLRSTWMNPDYSGPYILLGRAYLRTGDLAAAEGNLRKAMARDPNNRAAHYLLAQALQRLGREDEAAREFAAASALPEPGNRQ
jgi:tetratricopeptide (TPR) repeat protein